ncbi:MAG: hypothetical protein EXS68_03090 [Candidatus Ryanbacteria bacterium]|nr:hypothetical protein [Candidatus Ryanbacteria bacterium]
MEDQKFISHSQLAPPTTVPRQGLGLFSVLAIVVAVLALAFTGGLFLLKKSNEQQKTAVVDKLKELRNETELASLQNIKDIQDRIAIAKRVLDGHVYATQAFIFAERYTLATIKIRAFDFAKESVKMDLTADGYLEFAQQIKYYRDPDLKGIIKSYSFKPPTLTDRGAVDFAVEVVLMPEYLRTKPTVASIDTTEDVVLPPPPVRGSLDEEDL